MTDTINPKNETTKQEDTKQHKPGKLMTKVPLLLNTYDAQSLYTGNRKAKRIGLIPFARRMTELWYAAMNDDPYADWFLLKIYDKLIKLQRSLASELVTIESKLTLSPIQIEPFASETPVEKQLWFRTQYGYLAASLIADFDKLMRLCITAERIGILLNVPHSELRQVWMQKIGDILNLPKSWQSLSITRQDIVDNTDIVKQAETSMGKCPKSILDKSIRSPFAPFINENKEASKEKITN